MPPIGRPRALLAACLALGLATAAAAQDVPDDDQDWAPESGDLGGIGLMQVPTARMGDDGDVRVFGSFVTPYHRFGASAMVLPWAEAVFRLTQITNVPYGPESFSGNQSYRDRGIDFRFRLLKEDEDSPDLTVGLRDVAGTGLFDAEYIVASRRYYDWDFTLGLGWGQLASDNMFRNPLTLLGGWFDTRSGTNGTAGDIRFDYFTGHSMSLFGGVEYRTPIDGLSLQLEFNPDDYRDDPFIEPKVIKPGTPVDFAVVYRPWPWVMLSGGVERGNTALLKLGFTGNLAKPSAAEYRSQDVPPRVTPKPPAIPGTPARAEAPAAAAESAAVATVARRRGWRIAALDLASPKRGVEIVQVASYPGADGAEDVGQIARAAARIGAPPTRLDVTVIDRAGARHLVLDPRALGFAVAETGRTAEVVAAAEAEAPPVPAPAADPAVLDRKIADDVFRALDRIGFTGESLEIHGHEAVLRFSQPKYRVPARAIGEAARVVLPYMPSEVLEVSFGLEEDGIEIGRVTLPRGTLEDTLAGTASAAEFLHYASFSGGAPEAPDAMDNTDAYPGFDYRLHPGLKTQLNGPDGFFFYELYAGLAGEVRVWPGVSLNGEIGASVASNFDQLTLPSDSVLPHVRSDIADYLRDGRYGISRLETDVIRNLDPDLYGRITAGLLEEMFAGVDGEILYRPSDAPWALGLDLNHLWQRGFHERFGLRAYQVTTGQAEAYYQLPWYGLVASVKAGRYLAGDWGGTIDVSREFESGVKIGAFATFTNVSAQQFGEGSFDKGIYVSIPLELILPYPSRSTFDYTYRPVTRDGGQLVDIDKPLYEVTDPANPDRMEAGWEQIDD